MEQRYQHVYECNECSNGIKCPCFHIMVNLVPTMNHIPLAVSESQSPKLVNCQHKFKHKYSIPYEGE